MVGDLAACVWTCLLKMAFLSLRLHWGFTISYLDPIVPTKVLLSVDGCQIIVIRGGNECGMSYLSILMRSLFMSLLGYFMKSLKSSTWTSGKISASPHAGECFHFFRQPYSSHNYRQSQNGLDAFMSFTIAASTFLSLSFFILVSGLPCNPVQPPINTC